MVKYQENLEGNENLPKVGPKIWQNLNKTSKISKKFQNFAKSGHTVTNVDFKLIYINQEKTRSRVRLSNSVTRFGEISPLWQNFKSLWNF